MINNTKTKETLNLGGVWKYQLDPDDKGMELGYNKPDQDVSSWKDMKIPNNWYLTEVGDYFGTVWFSTRFQAPDSYKDKKLFLRFGAVDYYADVWLNGEYLGFHEGMFNPFEFDVTGKIKLGGENILVVRDGAPRDGTEYIQADFSATPLSDPYKKHQAKDISQIKGHMIDAMHRNGSFTKFRGDGNSGGIWDDVELIARPDVYIDFIKIFTRIGVKKDWLGDKLDKQDGTGLVAVDVSVQNTTSQIVETELKLSAVPHNFDEDSKTERIRKVVLQPGKNQFKLVITIQDAKLWWTWDHGDPNLYTATVSVCDHQVEQNFGIKEVFYDEKAGQWYLNFKHIFIRGMRYISSLWMSEANEKMWKEDLDKMLDMDINSIRIGSHVEKDGFYTMCDELGLLVWQVFPLHYCVSDSDDFIERASEMILDMGMMLCNHASMGMWSVFKEPEIYLLPDKPNNYFRLCRILKETLGTIDPTNWIHLGDYREGVQNLMIGSCQPGDIDLKKIKIQPNIVEFGGDSIPCLETLKELIPEDKLWPPHWDTWEYWGLFYQNTFNNGKVEMGDSLEEFINNTQAYEALVVKEQIEALRQRKYQPVSSMYLYYWSDPCPIMGSGLFDYYRRPYQVYYSMKEVYTQVLISLEWNADPYIIGRDKIYDRLNTFVGKVWVNNDHFYEVENAVMSWKLIHEESGDLICENSIKASLKEDSAEIVDRIIWPIPHDAIAGQYKIEMLVKDAEGNTLSKNDTKIMVR